MAGQLLPTAGAVARRRVRTAIADPAYMVPPLLLPLMFFAAFAGGLSKLGETPDFTYPDYTAFVWVFVFFMGASFVAVFTGFTMVADFESGFARRLMLAAPQRISVVLGFVLGSLAQAVVSAVILFVIGLVAGMDIDASPLQLLAILVLALLWNIALMLFVSGVGLRLQKVQTGSLMMIMPVFVILFVAPVYLPREQLTGWLGPAADHNPLSALFEASRGLLVGQPEQVGVAFASVGALILAFLVWAILGVRRFERGG
jgi:ABC-type multidrug transport system permease subunit